MLVHGLSRRAPALACPFAQKIVCLPSSLLAPRRLQSTASLNALRTCPNTQQRVARQTSLLCRIAPYVRRASTTATTRIAPAAQNNATTAQPLTWNRFLEIRKVRRQISVIASVIGVGSALFLSTYVITSQDVDVLGQKYLGLDAFITMGIIIVGTSAAGWLIGPMFGNAIFNLRYRALRSSILVKEKDFFQRIAKHRVDPTRSSYQNPVPDYYGEKIGSLRDYRRWLKDQRAFNLKRAACISDVKDVSKTS